MAGMLPQGCGMVLRVYATGAWRRGATHGISMFDYDEYLALVFGLGIWPWYFNSVKIPNVGHALGTLSGPSADLI